MIDIWSKAQAALAPLAVPMGAGAYVPASGALPDTYLIYHLVSSPARQHADGAPSEWFYRVQVTIYSRAGLAALPNIDAAMIGAGFARGPVRELPYVETTRHYSLAKEYTFLAQE